MAKAYYFTYPGTNEDKNHLDYRISSLCTHRGLLATAPHPHLYNTSQKKSHLQRYSKKEKNRTASGYSYSNLGNTNNGFTDCLYDVSFPNCTINLPDKLAAAKVGAGKQKLRVEVEGERTRE